MGLTGKQNSEKWIFEKIKAECPIRRSDSFSMWYAIKWQQGDSNPQPISL